MPHSCFPNICHIFKLYPKKNICHKKSVFNEGHILLQPLFILQTYYKRLLQLENTKLDLRLDLPILNYLLNFYLTLIA